MGCSSVTARVHRREPRRRAANLRNELGECACLDGLSCGDLLADAVTGIQNIINKMLQTDLITYRGRPNKRRLVQFWGLWKYFPVDRSYTNCLQ